MNRKKSKPSRSVRVAECRAFVGRRPRKYATLKTGFNPGRPRFPVDLPRKSNLACQDAESVRIVTLPPLHYGQKRHSSHNHQKQFPELYQQIRAFGAIFDSIRKGEHIVSVCLPTHVACVSGTRRRRNERKRRPS